MRSARARALIDRYPQAAEVLGFMAKAYEVLEQWETPPEWDDLPGLQDELSEQLEPFAPAVLRSVLILPEDLGNYFNKPDPYDPRYLFARLALGAWAHHAPLEVADGAPNECPRCGHAPQLGVLRPAGNGDALFLACSLCRHEWPFRRSTCPECGETDQEKVTYYTAEGTPQVRTQCCQTCKAYIHLLMPEQDLEMIPEVDELASLALDVWAIDQGFHKVWPNLAGL